MKVQETFIWGKNERKTGEFRYSMTITNSPIYDDWMQETTQRIIKLLGLLLPDLLVKKCLYQTSLRVL